MVCIYLIIPLPGCRHFHFFSYLVLLSSISFLPSFVAFYDILCFSFFFSTFSSFSLLCHIFPLLSVQSTFFLFYLFFSFSRLSSLLSVLVFLPTIFPSSFVANNFLILPPLWLLYFLISSSASI